MMFDLKLQKVCCANEVSNLKKSILGRPDVLHEHNRTRRFFLKRLKQEIRNRGLTTIIIHLDVRQLGQLIALAAKKVLKSALQFCRDLRNGTHKAFIHGKAMIFEIYTMRERQHTRENATTPFTTHNGICFLSTNQRPGMETMLLKSNLSLKALKFSNAFINAL